MALYYKVATFLFILATLFGLVGPYLISAAHTELVCLGILLLALSGPFFWWLGKSIKKDIDALTDNINKH